MPVWGSRVWGSTKLGQRFSDLEPYMPVLKKNYRGPFNLRLLFREKSTFVGLVIEQINFFGAGQRTNQLFWGWSSNKSTFLELVSEKINFFSAGQRKSQLFWDGMSLGGCVLLLLLLLGPSLGLVSRPSAPLPPSPFCDTCHGLHKKCFSIVQNSIVQYSII